MAGATLVLGAAFWLIWATAEQADQTSAYLAFTGGLLAWGWQEISLYTGYVTGPRKVSCPAGCKGWRHFGHAIQVNLWHELAIIAMAGALAVMVWDAENKLGLWTYLLLWACT